MTTTTKRDCDRCHGANFTRTDRRTTCNACKGKFCDRCVVVSGRGKTRRAYCTTCNRSR